MKQKVLVVAGPTGVGKTACSIALAKAFQGEIINGDAMQVYRGLDIGTAKITKEEMEMVPHHMIDCYSFSDPYNVMIFQEKGREYIQEITQRHKLPIVCGGTGLYIKSLLYDYIFDKQEKDEEFLSFLSSCSNEQLYALLKHVDADACDKIHPHNRQRLIRAVEMAHAGKKKSELLKEQTHTMLYDAYLIGLTMERSHLYKRIDDRVEHMIAQGLYEEITSLIKQDPHVWDYQSFQSIGYKEWKDHFEGDMSIEACIEKIKKNSRNFAKRQYTWFHNQLPMHWYHIEEHDWMIQLMKDINAWMSENRS